jgi:hypothetical protein
MKRKLLMSRLLLLLTVQLLSLGSFAQTDTLLVSHQATSYLLFNEDVALVDVGMDSQYYVKIEGNAVFLKAHRANSTPTSLFVKHGDTYFTAFLSYRPSPGKMLYDYRSKDTGTVRGNTNLAASTSKTDKKEVEKRLTSWRPSPSGSKHKKVGKSGLSLSLDNIENDKQATYIGFTLSNTSSVDFVIDLVTFEQKEKRGKRFSQNNISSILIEPLDTNVEFATVEAKTAKKFSYAIPLFAMRERGKLIVTFREKSGSRIISILIPARYINNASLYQLSDQTISSHLTP